MLPGLGTALTGIGAFNGPADFVEALAESHIVRRPRSLLYLQSLKLIQTSLGGSRDVGAGRFTCTARGYEGPPPIG